MIAMRFLLDLLESIIICDLQELQVLRLLHQLYTKRDTQFIIVSYRNRHTEDLI